MKKIALIGLGPHSKRIYFGFIKKDIQENEALLSVLVELESKREATETFLNDHSTVPEYTYYVPDKKQISPKKIDSDLKHRLDELIKNKEITHAIISTEPKSHKVYLDYFISKGISCLTDKPIVAREGLSYSKRSTDKQYKDILYLAKKSNKNNARILVQVQRREHVAYKFIFDEALKVVKEYGMPISYFHIYHSDGTWNMPLDFESRENHPYKYGYGKLMHSGYHFIDLVAWIAEINKNISNKLSINTKTDFLLPDQHYNQIDGVNFYKKVFDKDTKIPKNKKFGEIDSFSTIKMFRGHKVKDKNILSYGTVDLLQSGFSKRSWFDIAKDTYKGNGRLRHESINLHIGPLCNIQLHSYQSNEIGKSNLFGIGGEEHLDVYIFRNSSLIGGKDFEVINFGEKINGEYSKKDDHYLGQNEVSRYIIYRQFMDNKVSDVDINKQLLTNKLLSSFYKSYVCKKSITDIL